MMFIMKYVYIVSYVAFLIKRVPVIVVPQESRSPGLTGRFRDARKFANLTRDELANQRWLKSPTALAFGLMATVHYTVFLSGFIFPVLGRLAMFVLYGAGIINNTDPFVLLVSDLITITGCLLLAIGLTIGFPFYRFAAWLEKEGVYMRRLTPEELATTFEPPAKFRPRAVETLTTLAICISALIAAFALI